MKRLLFVLLIFLFSSAIAQHYAFYGTTLEGGTKDSGVLFKYDPATGKEDVEYTFNGVSGSFPSGKLLLANDGLLYGVTSKQGKNNYGTLFSFNFHSKNFKVLYNFDSINGWPDGDCPSLIQAKNGLLYGVAVKGGKYNKGVLYSFNTATDSEKVLHSFNDTTGGFPSNGVLAYDTINEILYGSTGGGGIYGNGVIYSYSILTSKYNLLLTLNNTLGDNTPGNDLYLYNDTVLYCMTNIKAKYNRGALLRYSLSTGKDSAIINFKDSIGETPQGNSMMMANNGMIYGLVDAGGMHHTSGGFYDGVIFSLNPITNNYSVIFLFDSADGGGPEGALVQNPGDGLFYGITQGGGGKSDGVIFSYDIGSGLETILHSFYINTTDGAFPSVGMTLVNIDDTLVGINQLLNEGKKVKVWPNPSNGKFTIESSIGNDKPLVEIYNMLGEKVYSETLQQAQGDNTINLKGQSEGIYLYRLISEKGEFIGSGKLVIQY